jgi:hypothetical protein
VLCLAHPFVNSPSCAEIVFISVTQKSIFLEKIRDRLSFPESTAQMQWSRSCCFYDGKRVPSTAVWIAFIVIKAYHSCLELGTMAERITLKGRISDFHGRFMSFWSN